MPPKSLKKEADGKDENDGDIQGLLLEKELEIETLLDKLSRLERRSQSLANIMEKQQVATKDMEEKLRDVINCLTSEIKTKEAKVYELEQALKDLKAENIRAIDNLTKDMHELQNTHKFVTEDLWLQLANAEVQLRDIDDFRAKKTAIEQEIASLKEQLEKEKKEHQDAISDTERSALQEKERLKKEMVARIEETKMQMLQQMDEQLHAKTKRTIVENDQLGKELAYHIRQTELLLQKNEKLVQENIELHRQVLLAKEVEGELARRNHMNQKTIRILLYKLQAFAEGNHAGKPGQNIDEQELKTLVCEHEQVEFSPHILNQELEQIKSYIQEQTRANESVSSAEEAMKFLYACLEDIELEKISSTPKQQGVSKCETVTILSVEGPSRFPSSLDQFTSLQRQELLMHLLRTAVSLRAVAQNTALQKPSQDLSSMVSCAFCSARGRGAVSVEDILNLPVENSHLDEPLYRAGSTSKPVSIGVQTEAMNLEERLALEIKERLRPCSSLGAVA